MKSRLVWLVALLAAWQAGLGYRLYRLQVEEADDYRARARRQHQRVVELEPPRGTMYDAAGRVLAASVEVESAFAVPDRVEDPAATARKLSELLGIDRSALERRIRSARDFVWVQRKLDRPQAEAVRALELPGIYFLRESKRYYPMRELAAAVLGFVGTDHRGLAGLEARYDELVAGRPGRRTVLRDARRRGFLFPHLFRVEAKPGSDLHLTLDAVVQHLVEKELVRTVEKFAARRGTAVVLDVHTGGVLAMATVPGFDPNHFGDYPQDRWRNSAIQDAYEPGSTFKIVTAAAVLAHGIFEPHDLLDCEMGAIRLAGVTIRDHKPFGVLTLAEVLARSSNVGAIKMGLALGDRRLFQAIDALGFGRGTGVDLPGESAGILRPVADWTPLSKAYVSFGQEVSVTPLQLARAVAAVAADGRLPRPHLVSAVTEGGRRTVVRPPAGHRAVLDPAVARRLRRLLRGVVVGGTGEPAEVAGYPVAGKTGTAQKAVDGRYSGTRFVASFVGFLPADDPRLVGLVAIDEPKGAIHGSVVAAPAFAEIMRQVALYQGIPPRREAPLRWPQEPLVRVAETSSSEERGREADPRTVAGEERAPAAVPSFPAGGAE